MTKYLLICLFFLITASEVCTSSTGITVDVPKNVQLELAKGIPKNKFVLYTLGKSLPSKLDDLSDHPIFICGNYPPLIPNEVKATLLSGSLLPGTLVQLSSDDFENATKGRVKSTLRTTIFVTVRLASDACFNTALTLMERTPKLLLLTEKAINFDGKDRLVEIKFQ